MLITDDIYNDLSKRIEAGEFLKDDAPTEDELPSLPEAADANMKTFYEDCKATISLYQQKLTAMSKKTEAALEAAKAKELACISSDLTNEFNDKLQAEYERHKAASEEAIQNLHDSLAESTKISSEALARSKKLAEENERLKAENEQLKTKKNGVGYFGQGMSDDAISLLKASMEEVNLDESPSIDTKISKAKSDLVEKVFSEGVRYVSNINLVKTGEEVNVCMSMLATMTDASKELLDKDTLDSIKNAIIGIFAKRDDAKKKNEEVPRKIENHYHDNARSYEHVDKYIEGGH